MVAQPRHAQHPRRCELEPGLRIIEGRVFYSAAWLDQATRTPRTLALTRGQHDGLGG
jgi:hypothetical protein